MNTQTFSRINIINAKTQLTEGARLVDIRDDHHFLMVHHKDAFHLTNENIAQFFQNTQLDTPILVVCYHGNSSQNVAQYLVDQGYETVYSVDGGMTAWSQYYPEDCESRI